MDITLILIIATIATTVSMTGSMLYHTWQMKKTISNYFNKEENIQ